MATTHSKRAFTRFESIAVLAFIAIALAVFLPLFSRVLQHYHQHSNSVFVAVALAVGSTLAILGIVFGLIPLILAAPCAVFVKLKSKSSERFRHLLLEYWSVAAVWIFVLLTLFGLFLFVYEKIISPLMRYFGH